MFHIYEGFNLVETYHKMRHQRKYHPEDGTKRVIKIALVAFVTLLLWNMPTEWFGIQNLTIVQQRVIAIFAFATLMWILEIVSSWATSIAIIVLMLLFCTDSGIAPMVNEEEVGKLLSYKGVMACFADPVIMLFIGGFVLAIAATKTGLDAQLAKVLLRPFGTKSEMVLLGFLLVTGLFSMFVSNTATAAMMLTFLTPVFRQLPPEGKGRIALAMSIPVAANLGGMGTPIGTPPNNIALKYLNDPEGLNMGLGFGQWMMFMFPLVVVLLFISWRLLLKFFPFSQKTVELKIDGSMQKGFHSKVVIFTFILTVVLWLSDRFTGINANTVAMVPFCIFALTGVINKRDLEQINWSVIWMVAGGFLWLGSQCRREYSLRRILTIAHPAAWRCHLLRTVELHLELGNGSTADAYSGCGLRRYGRQARPHRRYRYRTHWCGHRSIVCYDTAHLYASQCLGFRYRLC